MMQSSTTSLGACHSVAKNSFGTGNSAVPANSVAALTSVPLLHSNEAPASQSAAHHISFALSNTVRKSTETHQCSEMDQIFPKVESNVARRVMILAWLCFLVDREAELSFLFIGDNLFGSFTSFYISRAVGVILAAIIMHLWSLSEILTTSLFLTGLLLSFQRFYTPFRDSALVCCALLGLACSPLMLAVITLTASHYRIKSQPICCIIWGTAAPMGIALVTTFPGSYPIIVTLQGLLFSLLSWFVHPLLKQSTPVVSKAQHEQSGTQSNSSRFWKSKILRDTWQRRRVQITQSVTDSQIYVFFTFAVMNGYAGFLDLYRYSPTTGNTFTNLQSSTTMLGGFVIIGLVNWKKPDLRIVLLALISLIEPIAKWYLHVISGDFTLICTIPLLTANVQGSTRRVFISSTFYAGHNLGRAVWLTLAQYFHTSGAIYRVAVEAIKPALIVAYAIWIVRRNRRRRRVVAEMGISEEDSKKFGELAGAADMTDIESVHFRYRY